MRAFTAQLRLELILAFRNGEQILVNLLIPLGLLVLMANIDIFDESTEPIQRLGPTILALAVMSSSLVSLGVGTGFERFYGVLKRLGATPLGRGRWVAAKFGSIMCIELVQWCVIVAVALALGWSPQASGWLPAIAAAALATSAFGGLALLLAGTLKGLTNLALCNALYLVLLVTGGMVIPLAEMPTPMATAAKVFPAGTVTDHARGIPSGGIDPFERVARPDRLGRRDPAVGDSILPLGVIVTRTPARPCDAQSGTFAETTKPAAHRAGHARCATGLSRSVLAPVGRRACPDGQ